MCVYVCVRECACVCRCVRVCVCAVSSHRVTITDYFIDSSHCRRGNLIASSSLEEKLQSHSITGWQRFKFYNNITWPCLVSFFFHIGIPQREPQRSGSKQPSYCEPTLRSAAAKIVLIPHKGTPEQKAKGELSLPGFQLVIMSQDYCQWGARWNQTIMVSYSWRTLVPWSHYCLRKEVTCRVEIRPCLCSRQLHQSKTLYWLEPIKSDGSLCWCSGGITQLILSKLQN